MPKLPVVSGKETMKALGKFGFYQVGTKGSHNKLRKSVAGKTITVIVPNHKTIKPGTLRNGILKTAGLSVDEFRKLLR
jgi:predicted RNA binding protein YcfA (HicA-like mRNA interferase family)